MTGNTTDLTENETNKLSSVTTPETSETLNSKPIIEEIEQSSNPWDNAPEGVVFYQEIKDNGQIIGFTIGAELAYKIGLDLNNYLNPEDIQQSDKDFNYYLKELCPMKTEEDLLKDQYRLEIQQLKKQLSDTDYKAIKYAEGILTEEEYAPDKQQRAYWRRRINLIQQEFNL